MSKIEPYIYGLITFSVLLFGKVNLSAAEVEVRNPVPVPVLIPNNVIVPAPTVVYPAETYGYTTHERNVGQYKSGYGGGYSQEGWHGGHGGYGGYGGGHSGYGGGGYGWHGGDHNWHGGGAGGWQGHHGEHGHDNNHGHNEYGHHQGHEGHHGGHEGHEHHGGGEHHKH